MNFRAFIEQGTGSSVTGIGAAGRLGQSPFTPEGPPKNPLKPSSFNVSDKNKTLNPPPSNMSLGTKPLINPPAGPFASTLKQPQPFQPFRPNPLGNSGKTSSVK